MILAIPIFRDGAEVFEREIAHQERRRRASHMPNCCGGYGRGAEAAITTQTADAAVWPQPILRAVGWRLDTVAQFRGARA